MRGVSIAMFVVLLFWCVSAGAVDIKIEEVTSAKGIKAWLVRDDKLPLISMKFAWRGGVEQDAVDKQGLATLASELLTQGAGRYEAAAFQKLLADKSIQLGFSAGRDSVGGALKTLRENRKEAFNLLKLAITVPRFDAEAIERARNQQLTAIQMSVGQADWQARYALYSNIFAGHPYSYRSLGTVATLKSITKDDISAFHSGIFAKDNLIVAVAGAISPAELSKALDEIFGNLPEESRLKAIPEVKWPEERATLFISRKGMQTSLLMAGPSLRRDDPDWYAAEIANYILGGGGFSSRLMKALRDKKGLTYGIGTSLVSMDRAAAIIGSVDADNAKVGEALAVIADVWQDLCDNGPSDEEVDAAKNYLTGSLPLALTSTSAIAGTLVDIRLENLGIDYLGRRNELIQKVGKDDINLSLIHI